jgi:sugar lactone lactonase YvrE
MKFKLLVDAGVTIAETPIWDNRIKKLYWTDTLEGDIHQLDPISGKEKVWSTGKAIGAAVPCDDENKLFCALEGGMYLLDLQSEKLDFIVDPEQQENYKYNDTRIDIRGRIFTSSVSIFFGTDNFKADMLGGFYMVDTDGTIKTLAKNIVQYNAIVWNKDNTKMYVVDTGNHKLLVFPYSIENGASENFLVGIDFKDMGMPDGISIDTEDNLYVCHWSGKVSIWDKTLALKEIIDFPVDYVSCGGFGGETMHDFFVATSKYGYTEDDLEKNPGAGGIFVAKSPITGRSDYFYQIK